MERILEERKINWLLHFTQATNLPSIFQYGILPKSELLKNDIPADTNDDYRYDDCEDAICTSIEFPNYKMFWGLRQDDPDVDWAVLLLNSQILLDFECAFCTTNAGSAMSFNIPLKKRMGEKAFLKLFDEIPHKPSRRELGLRNCYPTDPQAEVLVFGRIPIDYIATVYFEKTDALNAYSRYIPQKISAEVNRKPFGYRYDWEHWKGSI